MLGDDDLDPIGRVILPIEGRQRAERRRAHAGYVGESLNDYGHLYAAHLTLNDANLPASPSCVKSSAGRRASCPWRPPPECAKDLAGRILQPAGPDRKLFPVLCSLL